MELRSHTEGSDATADIAPGSIYVVKHGRVERMRNGTLVESLGPSEFFGEDTAVFGIEPQYQFRATENSTLYEVSGEVLSGVPIVLWKLLETHERRTR